MEPQRASANLTREETRARAATVDVVDHHVTLDLAPATDHDSTTFTSTSTVRFTSTSATTWLDLLAPAVQSVVANGHEHDPDDVFDGARVRLADLHDDATTVNEVTVVADCAWSRSGEGMHRFFDPVDDEVYLYTQAEPADARRVFANFEQPDLKARFTFHVIAPVDWVVRSNTPATITQAERAPRVLQPAKRTRAGAPRGTRAGAERSESGADGLARWEFAPTQPISTYLTCVVAGPWHVVDGEPWRRGDLVVPMSLLCRRTLADSLDPDELFDLTRQGLDFFHDTFDVDYPFGRYDQAFVPEFNGGAMEHPGLVTFREGHVFQSVVTDAERSNRASTIMHEMAHMWFGDLVTMQWWDGLWLKESFADYMGTLATAEATRFTHEWTSFAVGRKGWAYRQDQLRTTHPIVADIPNLEAATLNFDGITYAKGASVLKQLVAWVGREEFLAGANAYFAEHAWGNTTLDDFLAALEASSGRDMQAWAEAWLETAGLATMSVEINTDGDTTGHPDDARVGGDGRGAAGDHGTPDDRGTAGDRTITHASLAQAGVDPVTGEPIVRPQRVVVSGYDMVDDAVRRTIRSEVDLASTDTKLDDLVGRPRPALVLPNDEDWTYAKVRLDATSLDTARDLLSRMAEPLPRALVWSALWSGTRDAVLPVAEFLDIAVDHAPPEARPEVLATVHQQVRTALTSYLPSRSRADWYRRTWEVAVAAAGDAPAGGNRQLAWMRQAIRLGSLVGAEAATWLHGLLDGRGVPDGVDLDTDLRWRTLIALAAVDEVDDDRLDDELAREEAARTRRWRATARAARPTSAAKQSAWDEVVGNTDLTNRTIGAIVTGWARPEQHALTADFEQPWLDGLRSWWSDRTTELATRLVRGLAPPARDATTGQDPDDHATVRAIDGWLDANDDAPRALRRLVIEERDHLVRALRVQAGQPGARIGDTGRQHGR